MFGYTKNLTHLQRILLFKDSSASSGSLTHNVPPRSCSGRFATRYGPEGILWLSTQNEHTFALGRGFYPVLVAFYMPIFVTVRSCDAMFATRQSQSCQFPSFRMTVPVSTGNYVALVRHQLTLWLDREKMNLQLPTISVKGSI
jgi:hypothetical protein